MMTQIEKSTNLRRSDFEYSIPDELIAQIPREIRSAARLLEFKHGKIGHHRVRDLAELIPEGSLIVRNRSKVLPGRIYGKLPTGGRVELFLLEKPKTCSSDNYKTICRCIGKPMRKLLAGKTIEFEGNLRAMISKRIDSENILDVGIEVTFLCPLTGFLDWIEKHGQMPLPPYITRKNTHQETLDRIRYQTTYSQETGSVAAPTAGLHFDEELCDRLSQRGIQFADVILHVGAGTFMPVRQEDIALHNMHSETFFVPSKTLNRILYHQDVGKPIILVGTTTLRALESLFKIHASGDHTKLEGLCDQWHSTDLFIRPKTPSEIYQPWVGNALMTNFHQPGSTLIMLVSALIGYQNIQKIYKTAMIENYRFFSYGDSSLLWMKS